MQQNFQTTGTLTGKVYKSLTPENVKLTGLGSQLSQMENDFEDMKRAREEAKRQLERKFEEVHNEIEETKNFVIQQGITVNRTIQEFKTKYESHLQRLEVQFRKQNDDLVKEMNESFKVVEERANKIEQMIIDERNERIRHTEAELAPIRQGLIDLDNNLKWETEQRELGEKRMLKAIDDESKRIDKDIQAEKKNRNERITTVNKDLEYNFGQAEKLTKDFYGKTKDEFLHETDNLEKEMDNRFNHQDKTVDNLSNMVAAFQATLKVLGKEA